MCVELGSLDQVRGLQQQLEQLSPAELAAALAEADDVIANLRAGRDLRNSGSKIRVFLFGKHVIGGLRRASHSNLVAERIPVPTETK